MASGFLQVERGREDQRGEHGGSLYHLCNLVSEELIAIFSVVEARHWIPSTLKGRQRTRAGTEVEATGDCPGGCLPQTTATAAGRTEEEQD